jgi:hypothetical protein
MNRVKAKRSLKNQVKGGDLPKPSDFDYVYLDFAEVSWLAIVKLEETKTFKPVLNAVCHLQRVISELPENLMDLVVTYNNADGLRFKLNTETADDIIVTACDVQGESNSQRVLVKCFETFATEPTKDRPCPSEAPTNCFDEINMAAW